MTTVTVTRAVDVRSPAEAAERVLRAAAVAFAVVVLLHGADHLRRGADATPGDVFVVGSLAIVVEVGVVALVFARHRLAPIAATAAGLGLAAGYLVVHFTPTRSWLSDSFPGGDVGVVSWAAGSAEVVAALLLGWSGARLAFGAPALAMASADRSDDDDRGWRGALHPVVVGMAIGNVAIFVAAVAGG
jgi:hypothetical protein